MNRNYLSNNFEDIFGFGTRTSQHESYYDSDNNLVLEVNVLGHDPKNIDIELKSRKLSIKSKKSDDDLHLMRELDLAFSIADTINLTDKIDAKFINGILKIIFNVNENVKPKKIMISQ